jgi:molybdopterin converting factor subunit 1
MRLTIQLFAKLHDVIGDKTVTLELPDSARVADVRQELIRCYPQCQELLARSMIAVDQDMAHDDLPLRPRAEVAVLPPVSGG